MDAQSAINDLTGYLFCSESSKCKLQVSQLDLHRHFHALGAGVIEEVRIQRDKGFGFVRYSNHSEAALAIQMGNGRILCGKPIKARTAARYFFLLFLFFFSLFLLQSIDFSVPPDSGRFAYRSAVGQCIFRFVFQCSWGSKPTPPGTASTPLPPPASAAAFSGLSATDLIGYDRASLLGKMTASEALMYAQSQQALKQVAAMGMGAAGASQAIYDSGFQNINAAAQQFMYY
ncbi:hypothetical protein GW17_00037690 [Ensete ventricosum]|nr:hypothetical protein GW17_00037690 [Ensete ventricosum]